MSTVLFAVTIPALIFATGATVDYSMLVRSKSRLQAITDAAALASNNAKIKTDADALAAVTTFVQSQITPDLRLADAPHFTVSLADSGRTTNVQLDVNFKPYMLGAVTSKVAYTTRSTVKRGLDNTLELSLVLDTTGSMAASNKITTLKSAASNMVDILMASSSNQVSIAVVPFAQYVNIGTKYRNSTWLTRSDDYSVTTSSQSCTTPKTTCATYTTTSVCVASTKTCTPVTTTTYNDGVPTTTTTQSCTTTCTQYQSQQTCSVWNYGPQQCTTTTSTANYKWTGCVGSRAYPLNLTDGTPATQWPALYNNTSCPAQTLMELSTDKTAIKTAINALTPSGETYMPSGLVWGLHTLSPAAPLTTAAAYDPKNVKPRKALVFMTDGINTKSMTSTTSTTHTGTNTTQANTYTSTLCTNIKTAGIEVYVISLMVTDATAMQMLKACATDTAHYFDATDATALTAVFQAIAFSLQRPYLAN